MKNIVNEYLKQGFNPIPVNNDKTPACDWKYFQENYINDIKLFTTDSIAIICGKISHNLEVLDFDNHGGTAKDNLTNYIENSLVKSIYDKYKFPIIQTQGGGFHLYYRADRIEKNQKLAMVKLNGKPDAIIETRGEGGYVLAPPSKGYKVIRNNFEDLQQITEQERSLLIEIAKTFNKHEKSIKKYNPNLEDEKPGNIYDNLPESITEAKQCLESVGWIELGFNNAWRRPGKNSGISATFGNVAPNVFYSFSSNIEYFDNETGYTPFQIVGLIKYNGNFSEFAGEIAKKYNLNNKIEQIKPKQDTETLIKKVYSYKLDWTKEYKMPTPIFQIKDEGGIYDIGTLGNFSAFTGKSKSRKSFAKMFFEAAAIGNKSISDKFSVNLPNNKNRVILIDTEQGVAHVMKNAYRAVKLANVSNIDNYDVFPMREFGYMDRCLAVEQIVNDNKDLGVLFIDGIADLAFGNNDEQEANRVVQLLMTWTAKYNIHVSTVIHQPKGSDWATGHLGSAIEKKAESVINIKKEDNYSIFEPKQLRNCADFTPFPFLINKYGLPELITDETEIENIYYDDI